MEHKDDLELKQLGHFTGSQKYFGVKPLFHSVVTEGVDYIATNGYSWLMTDALAVIEHHEKVMTEPFISVKMKVNKEKKSCFVEYSDGDNNVLFTQKYAVTNAKRDIAFFYYNNVLMLDSEY